MSRSHAHQQSSVLPLMTWPSQAVTGPSKDPRPAHPSRSPEERHERNLVPIGEPSLMTSKEWVQRASQLKDEADDVLFSRSPSFQQWQDRRTIRLLEEHWHAVTAALKNLSSEVIDLQAQVQKREKTDVLANDSVKSFSMQQAGLIQDLRGRIGRCDSSIAVLSNDIRSLAKDLSTVHSQLASLSIDIEKGNSQVDQKVRKLQSSLQEQTNQQSHTQSITETKLQESLTSMEFKTKGQLRELQENIQAVQTEYQTRQKKLQQELGQTLEQLTGRQQQSQAHFEKQMTDKFDSLQRGLTRLESEQEKLRHGLEMQDGALRGHISGELEKLEARLHGVIRLEVKDVKSSVQSGLGTMQSNVETMRRVLEGKQRLSEEALKKDIARMKKLVLVT